MVSDAQVKFFTKLLGEKEFPEGTDTESLLEEFEELNSKSASLWIEKAMSLGKRDESNDPVIQPSF